MQVFESQSRLTMLGATGFHGDVSSKAQLSTEVGDHLEVRVELANRRSAMALDPFKYSYTQDQLGVILTWAISMVVADDLGRFDIRPKPSLQYLVEERGLGHEAGFEIDAYPVNKNEPVLFYIVQGDVFGCSADGNDVAIYSPEEFKAAVSREFSIQLEREPEYFLAVEKLKMIFSLS
ncbi:hypothetical protein JC881_18580 [Variovorax sp. IB41]|nr:hypothetical protein [Variovorax sp. IB41]